jgi:hypothetical protein
MTAARRLEEYAKEVLYREREGEASNVRPTGARNLENKTDCAWVNFAYMPLESPPIILSKPFELKIGFKVF